MDWQMAFCLLSYLLPFILLLGVGLYAARRVAVRGAMALALLAIEQAVWVLGACMELLSTSLEARLFWNNVQWAFAVFLPVVFLVFALHYSSHPLTDMRRILWVIGIVPALFLLLLFTDGLHGLVRDTSRLVEAQPFSLLFYDFTPLVWLMGLYSCALVIWGLSVLLRMLLNIHPLLRFYVGLVLVGVVISLLGATVALAGVKIDEYWNLAPFTFAIGDLFVAVGLFSDRFREAIPIAREAVIENLNEAMIVVDEQDRLVDLNPAAQVRLGRTTAGIIGQPVDQIYAPWSHLLDRHRDRGRLTSEVFSYGEAGDRHYEVRITPLHNRRGHFVGRLVLIRDITENKRVEAEIRDHRKFLTHLVNKRTEKLISAIERLRNYADHVEFMREIDRAILTAESPDAIVQVAAKYVVRVIPACLQVSVAVFDLKANELTLLSVPVDDLAHKPERHVLPLDRHPVLLERIRRGEFDTAEDLRPVTDVISVEQTIYVEGVRSIITLPLIFQDQLIGSLSLGKSEPGDFDPQGLEIVRQVVDQLAIAIRQAWLYEQVKQHAEELEQRVAERTSELEAINRELESFTYSVSHDLKAPLRGIDGYSRLLLEDYANQLGEDGRAFLQNVRRGIEQMNQLIEDLLEYSRLQRRSMQKEFVHLPTVLQIVIGDYSSEIKRKGVSLRVEIPFENIYAEREGLTQALRNLLDNALKYAQEDGEPLIKIGGSEMESSWIIWIRDNGVGFDMRYHDRIFQIFQRLQRAEDYPGTGVGLALVAMAMQRMGGRAWAESKPGAGATFYLELPKQK